MSQINGWDQGCGVVMVGQSFLLSPRRGGVAVECGAIRGMITVECNMQSSSTLLSVRSRGTIRDPVPDDERRGV